MKDLASEQLAALGFAIATALMTWRLWVGVKREARWPVLGLFALTFLLGLAGTRWVLGVEDLVGDLCGASGAYLACLLVTRGRPERMLEVWKMTGERPPSRQERRSVTLHQIAFCVLLCRRSECLLLGIRRRKLAGLCDSDHLRLILLAY